MRIWWTRSFGSVQPEENATGCSYHGANKLALGDLYIDPKVAEKPVDRFNTEELPEVVSLFRTFRFHNTTQESSVVKGVC